MPSAVLIRSARPLEFGIRTAANCAAFGLDLHVTVFEETSDFGKRAEVDRMASDGITRSQGFSGSQVIEDLGLEGAPRGEGSQLSHQSPFPVAARRPAPTRQDLDVFHVAAEESLPGEYRAVALWAPGLVRWILSLSRPELGVAGFGLTLNLCCRLLVTRHNVLPQFEIPVVRKSVGIET